ncbi:helix-turn-helix domain-containing protein [Breznakiellaceae bacterium SP9]
MTSLRHLLASNIKEHRKNLGLSQSKLAEKVDTATAYIGKIETEQQFPSPEMLERLAAALEIDSPQLFSMEPMQMAAVRKLRKDISVDMERVLSNRLAEFEDSFYRAKQ